MQIYRITLKCHGVSADVGARAAKEINSAFNAHEQHVDVHCWWDGTALFVTAWNHFDDTGSSLRNEFSELIALHVGTSSQHFIETIEVLVMR